MIKTARKLEFLIMQNLNNLADLPDNEDLIVKYLIHRYEKGEFYTWAGPVLLAINPRRSVLELYDESHQDIYKNLPYVFEKRSTIEPHVFAVAAAARYRLTHGLGKVNQAIVISGESGSGKTFSASKILHFLATPSRLLYSIEACDEVSSSTLSKIEKACLVISSFSTASTERNEYSSRHGQLVQLQYSNTSLQGAILNSFLLEQSRVTGTANNFHIFGQMLAGLSTLELETMKLSRSTFYKIVNSSCNINIVPTGLISKFMGIVEAMDSLGLDQNQRKDIFKVIALIIHFGNIEFEERVTGGCDVNIQKKDSAEAIEGASSIMVLPTVDLVKLLTTNLIRPCSSSQRHSTYYSAIATTEACNIRLHSIIRYLYHCLFQWLVNRLNESIMCSEESSKLLGNQNVQQSTGCGGITIGFSEFSAMEKFWVHENILSLGILDIFGFESFSENNIEQLSINYANEKMQNHFMQKYLEATRLELEHEGLSTLSSSPKTCIYKQRLAAIESGLFPVLNDVCLIARIEKHAGFDEFVLTVKEENARFIHNRGGTFAICHYSHTVEYKTADILRKNTDKVPSELLSTITLCQNKFILSLLAIDLKRDETQQQDRFRADKRKNTALAKLKHSMDVLIRELNKYDLHYIRCMKPVNHVNDPEMIKAFKEQLACSGILDALPLARCPLPIRFKYNEFSMRYSKYITVNDEIEDSVQLCKMIMQQILNKKELLSLVHFGSQLIFFAEVVLHKLELMRDEFRSQYASKIQSVWRQYMLKKRSRIAESSSRNVDLRNIRAEQLLSLDTKQSGFSSTIQGVNNSNKCCNFIVDLNNQTFFHRNRILSRRRLADVPVRFHTRLTCLLDSHRLPRSELPGGLKDCLG